MKEKLKEIKDGTLKEAKEIEEMNNKTLIEEFENLIRNGAGSEVRRVVFIKKEMLVRMGS